MNAVTETHAAQAVTGVEIFVPLNKLRKSPSNARKVPHGEAAIEALAASIHHKGMIQNLVVEPEMKNDLPTGYYLVTAGEGRRQAQLLRAKRKQISKAEPVRCWLDTSNDPSEVSLDENITRTNMHPADQFERFHELSVNRGWGAEEIGARFGVSAEIVKRRLRLGAVSPRLMDIYRQDGLTLDQLAAFAITDDHGRQEQVTHAMVSDLFYHGRAKSCLEVRATSEALGSHADGIADMGDAEALAARHDGWGAQLPSDVDDLWQFIAGMEDRSRDELLAHCVSLTVNAVKLPWDRSVSPVAAADIMASAIDLDMARHWTPTARSYFGRVTKDHIAQAVSEAVSVEAADRIRPMKKGDMADAAEQLVAGTEWLPQPLRTAKVESEPDMVANDDQQDGYAIAAE
jgi:ParB-like chromosome segregation protein Spo0J